MPERIIIRRFWQLRGAENVRRGAAEAAGLVSGEGLKDISTATSGRCTVLLGPPGAGKTTELKRFAKTSGALVEIVPVVTGSEDVLRAKIMAALDALAAGEDRSRVLALDSLDETALAPAQLAGIIEDLLPDLPEDLRLVIACRSAAWFPGVDAVLRSRYQDAVSVCDLAPLRRADIAAYATSAGVDGNQFLQAVEASRVMPLAVSPTTLGLLVDEYLAGLQTGDPALPSSQAELFAKSCSRLVQEPNPHLQSPLEPQDVASLTASVGHLAVLSLFSGRSSFVLVGEPSLEDLSISDCLPGVGGLDMTPKTITDGLATAVFRGVGEHRVCFAHQTLAEFLAARHLLRTGVSDARLDELLRGRGGLLAPQVQAVAAWLIALAPERFVELLKDDPAAFVQSSVELTDPVYRRTLVDGLLELTERNELVNAWAIPLQGLAFDGIEQRFQALLEDATANAEVRYLTIRIARIERLGALSAVLVALALNEGEMIELRSAAGHAVLEIGQFESIASLTVLAEGGGPTNDPDDELFGLGLQALLSSGTPPVVILPLLRIRRPSDLSGNYRMVLSVTLPEAFSAEGLAHDDLMTALNWAVTTEGTTDGDPENQGWHTPDTDRLLDAILIAGLKRLEEPDVPSALARLIATRIAVHGELLRASRGALPEISMPQRQQLLDALHDALLSPFDTWQVARSPLLTAEDLLWAVNGAEHAASHEEHERWLQWIRVTFDRRLPDHVEAIVRLQTEYLVYEETLRRLLDPPTDAERAVDIPAEPDERGQVPTEDVLRAKLLECLGFDDSDSFFRFCYWARFAPGQSYSHHELKLDVRMLPGWQLLTEEEREQAMIVAARYAAEAEPEMEKYLGTNEFGTAPFAGARALVLLETSGTGLSLSPERWAFWTPALVHGPFGLDTEDVSAGVLRGMARNALPALLATTEREMKGDSEGAQFTLRRVASALDVSAATEQWLMKIIEDEAFDGATAQVAFDRLLTLDKPAALDLLGRYLADPGDGGAEQRLQYLLPAALHVAGPASWTMSFAGLSDDDELARQVIESLAHDRELDVSGLREEQVIELWELVDRLFPRCEDPDVHGDHMVSPRESIGQFRERLLPAVAERGSRAALAALEILVEQRPLEPMLRRFAARARAALRRAEWTPLAPYEVIEALQPAEEVPRQDLSLLDLGVEQVSRNGPMGQPLAEEPRPVRVFISYAHDDEAHEEQVRALWEFLRGSGVDARLDLTAAQEPRDWTLWMGEQIREGDFVLVVGSPAYRRRAEGRADPDEGRGVQWEARLIRNLLYRDQPEGRSCVLPVLLPGATVEDLPDWLTPTTSTHYRVSDFSVTGAEGLYRVLTSQPAEVEPELGPLIRLGTRAAVSGPAPEAVGSSSRAVSESPEVPRVEPTSDGTRPARTSTWRHTTMGTPALTRIGDNRIQHPGYDVRSASPYDNPPAIRVGTILACDPLSADTITTSELRSRFLRFLNRAPAILFLTSLTTVTDEMAWSSWGGNGPSSLVAVLTDPSSDSNAPVAWARLNLAQPESVSPMHDSRCVEFIIVAEPRDPAGGTAAAVPLKYWLDRFVQILRVPADLASFLTEDLGLVTHEVPVAQVGTWLNDPAALVDITGFSVLPGQATSQWFTSYAVADADGSSLVEVAKNIVRQMCDYTMYLENYESILIDPGVADSR